MDPVLNGMQVAILVSDGFEQVELTEPKKALEQEGAVTKIVSDKSDTVQGMHHDQAGDVFPVDLILTEADAKSFNALLLPGGKDSAARLRDNPEAQRFVRAFHDDDKPIAAICHGPWLLVSANLVQGRTVTSFPSLETDLRGAGANWVDQEVVTDGNLVSSRTPDDILAFNRAVVEMIGENMRAYLQGTADEHAVGIASS